MSKYTKKWQKDFEKKYSTTLAQLRGLEKEFKEMVETNPDEWITPFIDESTVEFGPMDGFYTFHVKADDNSELPYEYIDITLSSRLSSYCFQFVDFKEAIRFRNDFIEAVDKFKRPEESVKLTIDSDSDCEDEDDAEETEWTIKAEQPLTQSWTYTVTAKSACEAIKKIENDEDGVENNDDNEYYDYGEIEYEAI